MECPLSAGKGSNSPTCTSIKMQVHEHAILETLRLRDLTEQNRPLHGGPSRPVCFKRLDRRIPRRGHESIALAVLFDVADRGEGKVEADHGCLLGGRHIVEFVAVNSRT